MKKKLNNLQEAGIYVKKIEILTNDTTEILYIISNTTNEYRKYMFYQIE